MIRVQKVDCAIINPIFIEREREPSQLTSFIKRGKERVGDEAREVGEKWGWHSHSGGEWASEGGGGGGGGG